MCGVSRSLARPSRPRGHAWLVLAGLVLAGASLALVAAGQTTTPTATVTSMDASPRVLPSDGGLLTIDLQATTDADELHVHLAVADPDGRTAQETDLLETAPGDEGTVSLEHDLDVDPRGEAGRWAVEVEDAVAVDEDGTRRAVDVDGTTRTGFQVNQHRPVGGDEDTPWTQSGGDPAHTGRTLAVGPDAVEVVRWTYAPDDRQPLHTPRVGPAGTIYAVSWGGEAMALDEDGDERWSNPVQLPGQVSFAPVVTAEGDLVVPDGNGRLIAITPNGTLDWRAGDTGSTLLSTPVVGPEGRIFAVEEPWRLVQVSPDGDVLHTTDLPEPGGDAPEAPAVPEPQPGPRLAVTPQGEAVVLAGDGLALVHRDGTLDGTRPFDCGCKPVAVSLSQDVPVALAVANDRLSAMSVRTGIELWNVTDAEAPLDGQLWRAASVGWSDQAFVTTEKGNLLNVSLSDPDDISYRRLWAPLRGQPVVDANHDVYLADACSIVRSLEGDFDRRWIDEIDNPSCNGLTSSLAITRSGNLLWPGPDGELRLLGSNRAPEAAFTAGWHEGAFRLDASNTTDPDGDDLSYAWRIGNTTTDQGRVLEPDLGSGTHAVTLTVSDGTTSATASREVTVNLPPEPRIVDAGQGLHVELDAASTQDPDGDELSFNWTVDDELRQQGPVLAFNASNPRVFDVELAVEDAEHTVTERRTVVAPHPSVWTTTRVALYGGDCPSGVCAAPERVEVVNGSLTKFQVINGADQPVDVASELPGVPGSPDRLLLDPGETETVYTQPSDGEGVALRLTTLGGGPATVVSATVVPAPAEVTWQVTTVDREPSVGFPAQVHVHLEGSAPPRETGLEVALVDGERAVGSQRVPLPAGQPVDTTAVVAWTPETVGERDLRVEVTPEDDTRARTQPAEDEPAAHTFAVQEATVLDHVVAAVDANRSWLAATGIVAVLAGAAGALVYRRRAEPETEGEPSAGTDASGGTGSPVPTTGGDETVASSFMPRKVERFHVDQVLGEGGFGKTYLAEDTVLEREVVLKELEHVGQGEARDLLLHEAKTAANLQHNNVVVVHDVVEEEGRLVLVMEHVPGGTLEDRLGEPMPVKQALPLIADVLEGLAALHEAGIVHRDVKPTNILMAPDGDAKITDFGVAAHLEDEGSHGDEGTFVGTPRYMAPEQLAGDPPGPQADVYAAGALLYRMLTGEHHLGLGDETPPPDELVDRSPRLPTAEVPDEVNRVLERALAKDPGDRFEDAGAFLEALRRFPGSQADETPPPA